jgi:chromosome segregation ATPase
VTPLKGDASHASSVGSKSAIEQMTVITKQLDETNEQVKSLCEKVEHQNKSIEKMSAEREQQTETISRLEASNRELGEQYKQLQQATMLELEKVRGENVRAQTELTNALIKLSERLESKGEAAKEMESENENECKVVEMVQTPRATAQVVEETKKKAIPVKRAASTIVKAKTTTMAKQTVRTQETRETGLVSLGKYKLGTRVSKSPGCEQIEEISSRESDTGDEAAVDPGKKN